ncbi:hypothetical protein B0H67DRAFT_588450 [Lasiosphaeris hirsuta]|uniref:Uncharacterized protein n=1 Tax=Lasiosphaeris hirsuta TaxID=260670 RepID=A0AA40DNW7_9PEZI|nr:hypothetical protein B0H67DRAFT_588450 [Lasiosphaeris hirsuta]
MLMKRTVDIAATTRGGKGQLMSTRGCPALMSPGFPILSTSRLSRSVDLLVAISNRLRVAQPQG